MAAIENLEVVVTVDVSSAIEDLQDLQDELEDVADEISQLRAQGAEGIGITTNVESIKDDLAALRAEIEAFEESAHINVGTSVAGRGAGGANGGGGGGGGAFPDFSDGYDLRYDDFFFSRDSKDPSALMEFMDFRGGGQQRGRLGKMVDNVSNSIQSARESIAEFDLRMSDLHNMLARLVPLLFVFIGAIPAAVVALYGLAAAAIAAAGALVALTGFGALGFGMAGGEFSAQRLSEAFSDLADDFLDTFAPLANQLQPLFEDTLAGLEEFFDAVADNGDALLALEDDARAFGSFLLSFVPDMLRTLAALVEGMAGTFGDIGGFLRANFASIVETLLELTVKIIPVLASLGQTLAAMLPAITRLSAGFLQVVNIIVSLIGVIGYVLSLFGITARGFGIIAAAALTAATAVLLSRTALLTLAYEGIAAVVGTIYSTFVPAVATMVSALTSSAVATYILTAAVVSLLTLLTLGAGLALIGLATTAAAKFTNLAGSIGDASDSLKEFRSIQSGMSGSGFGGGGSDNPYGFDPDNPTDTPPNGGGSVTVFNVESSGDAKEDRSNLEHADWLSGRTTTQ